MCAAARTQKHWQRPPGLNLPMYPRLHVRHIFTRSGDWFAMIFNNLVCSQPRNTFPSSFPFHLFHPFCSLATIASLGGHAESYSSYRNEWPNGLKVESNYKWGTKLWMLRLSLSQTLSLCVSLSLSLSLSRSRSRALARFLVRTHFCLLKSHGQIRFHPKMMHS